MQQGPWPPDPTYETEMYGKPGDRRGQDSNTLVNKTAEKCHYERKKCRFYRSSVKNEFIAVRKRRKKAAFNERHKNGVLYNNDLCNCSYYIQKFNSWL